MKTLSNTNFKSLLNSLEVVELTDYVNASDDNGDILSIKKSSPSEVEYNHDAIYELGLTSEQVDAIEQMVRMNHDFDLVIEGCEVGC